MFFSKKKKVTDVKQDSFTSPIEFKEKISSPCKESNEAIEMKTF